MRVRCAAGNWDSHSYFWEGLAELTLMPAPTLHAHSRERRDRAGSGEKKEGRLEPETTGEKHGRIYHPMQIQA